MTFLPSYVQIDSPDPVNPQDLATKHYVDNWPVKASCRYSFSAFTTSATASTVQIVPFNVRYFDDALAYNTSTGIYTCPAPGIYQVVVWFGVNVASTVQINRYVYKNGAVILTNAVTTNPSGFQEIPSMIVDRCVAGDTLDVRILSSLASVALRSASGESNLCITYLGP